MRQNRHQIPILLIAASLLGAASCSDEPGPEEMQRLARAVAELQITHFSDSGNTEQRLDSVAREHGYSSAQDVDEEIRALSIYPDILRQVLDSTQAYLDRAGK